MTTLSMLLFTAALRDERFVLCFTAASTPPSDGLVMPSGGHRRIELFAGRSGTLVTVSGDEWLELHVDQLGTYVPLNGDALNHVRNWLRDEGIDVTDVRVARPVRSEAAVVPRVDEAGVQV